MRKLFPNIQYPISNIILIFLFIIALFYRLYGLGANYSFWNDENAVGIFTRAILQRGRPVLANGYSTGTHQWLWYWISAFSAKILGLNELALRLPAVVFGVLTIWAVWLLGKEFTSEVSSPTKVGNPSTSEVLGLLPLTAAILTTFAKIEILWSRQARPYQALQFFYLLSTWFILRLVKKEKADWFDFLGFLICGVLASLIHGLGLVVFFNGFLCLALLCFGWFRRWALLGLGPAFGLGYLFRTSLIGLLSWLGRVNNMFYYRVFLWHNYSLLVFLAVVGGWWLVVRRPKGWPVLILPLMVRGVIIFFLLSQPFTRYFYPVFPFLILLASVGLVIISQSLSTVFRERSEHVSPRLTRHISEPLISLILVLFIISMGHKFTLLPKWTYSLNEDMQEIPEVDWKRVYGFIGKKISSDKELVLLSNWHDHALWYLGEGYPHYLLRVEPYSKMPETDPMSGAVYLRSIEGLKKVIDTHPRGIVLLDSWDNKIPTGVREYCRRNLIKELEIDRLYPDQPRAWPVEIYSWRD